MNRRLLFSIALFLTGTLVLLPNFYRNRWMAVEPGYYTEWQTRYDRLVVARLVKTRQDGFFSAGGLMGLGDATQIAYDTRTHRHQFNTFLENGKFKTYFVYESNPGFQAILLGLADRILPISGEEKLKLFRAVTALASAMVFGLMFTVLVMEFGWLSGLAMLAFSIFSIWIVLPAGSVFWDLWAFFLPFLASAYLLWDATRKHEYHARKIHSLIFLAVLIKILFSGFDVTTTVLIMTSVPFIFYAVYQRWDGRLFLNRMIRLGLVLAAASLTGLAILSLQIIANEGSLVSAYDYILNRFGHHAEGSSEFFFNPNVEVRTITTAEVIQKYLLMPAINLRWGASTVEILYWHLIVVFALFTVFYFLKKRIMGNREIPRKALALIAGTWYSILAPLSWYVLFKPHSFIHTHVNTMGWQMPFTILGFALCGYVLSDFLPGTQKALLNEPASPASQSG